MDQFDRDVGRGRFQLPGPCGRPALFYYEDCSVGGAPEDSPASTPFVQRLNIHGRPVTVWRNRPAETGTAAALHWGLVRPLWQPPCW